MASNVVNTAIILQINACSLKTIDVDKNNMVQFKSLHGGWLLKELHIITVCEGWRNASIEDKDLSYDRRVMPGHNSQT